MALENPALNELSFRRGIEEAGAEPRGMSASGTYAIAGLLLAIGAFGLMLSLIWVYVSVLRLLVLLRARQ